MTQSSQDESAQSEINAMKARLLTALAHTHKARSTRPLAIPSTAGAFPDAFLATVPPVVADANVLRDDILYSCLHKRRTVLVNGANGSFFRLFCAQHVIDEVFEHGQRWAEAKNVAPVDFLACWREEYLPLIRVLRDNWVPEDTLSPAETSRIDDLRRRDPDDVPSAVLALLLGAYYMTEDHPALLAAYGPGLDIEQHHAWLDALRAGGNAGELEEILEVAAGLAELLGRSIVAASRRVLQVAGPWGLLPLPLLALWLAKGVSPETREGLRWATGRSMFVFFATIGAWTDARGHFEQMSVKVPSWAELAEYCDPSAVLSRTCLHTLSRSGRSSLSAVELATVLPKLPVRQSSVSVRAVLRSRTCFASTARGRWQVGTPMT